MTEDHNSEDSSGGGELLVEAFRTAAWVKTRTVGSVHTPAFPGHGALRECPFCGEYYRRHAGHVDHRDRCDPTVPTRGDADV